MTKKIKLISGTVLLTLIAVTTFSLAEGGNGEVENKGGNGEVIHTHCMSNKEEFKKCVKRITPNIDIATISVKIILDKAVKVATGRGDGYIYTNDINLTNQGKFIIHADISKAKKPVNSNILEAILTQDDERMTLDINVKDIIQDKVIIYNKDGKTLIEYTVTK